MPRNAVCKYHALRLEYFARKNVALKSAAAVKDLTDGILLRFCLFSLGNLFAILVDESGLLDLTHFFLMFT